MVVMGERTDCAKWVLSLFLVTKRLYAKEPEWSRGQIKMCRKKQHVKIGGMIGVANLICGKSAVGGNYNSTHDNIEEIRKIAMSIVQHCDKITRK